ncbi:hypothetical protein CCACVL1_02197, partial [Corchorus capsularis]
RRLRLDFVQIPIYGDGDLSLPPGLGSLTTCI